MKPGILTATLLTLSAASAGADTVCMRSAEMEASLIDWYGETPVEGTGTRATQVWASTETGTWTLLTYFADGNSCVLAQGTDWAPGRSDELLFAGLEE